MTHLPVESVDEIVHEPVAKGLLLGMSSGCHVKLNATGSGFD